MATTNPYDRRVPADNARGMEDLYCDAGPYDVHADGKRAYPGFSLARLEELLRDEFARGFNCGEGTMERHIEESILPDVKRKVWEQGHAAGVEDGAADLFAERARCAALTSVVADIERYLPPVGEGQRLAFIEAIRGRLDALSAEQVA